MTAVGGQLAVPSIRLTEHGATGSGIALPAVAQARTRKGANAAAFFIIGDPTDDNPADLQLMGPRSHTRQILETKKRACTATLLFHHSHPGSFRV